MKNLKKYFQAIKNPVISDWISLKNDIIIFYKDFINALISIS